MLNVEAKEGVPREKYEVYSYEVLSKVIHC